MTARTEIASATGILFALSASIPATFDADGYAATGMVYTAVAKVEDVGNEDSQKTVSDFTPVDTGIKTKVPGIIDFGKRTLMLGYLPGDTGQALMRTAFLSSAHYSAKITFPDGEVRYYDVLVTKNGISGGKAGDVVRGTAEIDICKQPVVVLP